LKWDSGNGFNDFESRNYQLSYYQPSEIVKENLDKQTSKKIGLFYGRHY